MRALTDKISEYIRLSSEIATLKDGASGKRAQLERKYAVDFRNLKSKLDVYFSKIRTTVNTLCNLYKATIGMANNRIAIKGECFSLRYSPTDACELAVRLCNESVSYLSQVIKRINVDTNLREFAKRYNTAIDIYESADCIVSEAASMEMVEYMKRIDSLEAKLSMICRDEDEFKQLLCEMRENSEGIFERAFIQDKKEMECELVTEIALPIGYEAYPSEGITEDGGEIFVSTLDWDLHKDGVLVIKADADDIDDDRLSACTVNTIAQFLFSYPTFTKKVLLCDSRSSIAVTSFAGILKSENNKMFFDNDNDSYVKNSDSDIRDSLAELNQIINQRLLSLAPSPYDDVLSFNQNNPDNPTPLIFVLLNGYPFRYDGAADDLAGILKNGKKVGVYSMIVESTTSNEEDRYYYRSRVPETDDITNNIAFFVREENEAYLSKDGKSYRIDTCGENYNLASLLSAFNKDTGSDAKKIMYFESILSDEDFESSERRVDYSRDLSIPVGKVGSNIVNIHLDASSALAHLAVVGASGSGKTAFVNTLVLSMCSLYSPDEVELHMILMAKDDFLVFQHHNLPHLKNIVTGDQVSRANDVLDYIGSEIDRRRALIGTDGSIYTYNVRADESLPRCVVIIDEFYELVKDDRDSVDKLVELAHTGRSYGVSLILSTIRFTADTSKIVSQVGNRIEFLSRENAGCLIPVAAKRQGELGEGRCFFDCDGKLDLVTVAYSESGEPLERRIHKVCDKYPNHRMEISNIVSVTRISKEDDVPYIVRDKKKKAKSLDIAIENYMRDWVLRVRLGKVDMLNAPLEFSFNNNNNVLFLFGRYLDTKLMEVSLIKDALILSRNVEEPAVFYIDCNDDVYYRYKTTVVKDMISFWDPSRIVYNPNNSFDDLYADISELIEKRQNDRSGSVPLYPVLVVISQGDVLFQENTQSMSPIKERDRRGDKLVDLITRGSKTLINFVIQFEQPIKPRSLERFMTDAIIFPGNSWAEDSDPTAYLCSAFECMPARSAPAGRQLISKINKYGIDPRLHLLCIKGIVRLFLPYDYDKEYLKNIAGLGDLL